MRRLRIKRHLLLQTLVNFYTAYIMSSKKFEIEADKGQVVLDYLITRPWEEVDGLIRIMTTLTELPEPKPAPKPKKPKKK